MRLRIDEIQKYLDKATPGPWSGNGNVPFYATLKKPAASLSKHDTPYSPHWRVEDVELVLNLRNGDAQFLIDEVRRLEKENDNLEELLNLLVDESSKLE